MIYARYCTDDQNQASISDQIKYCKQFLEDNGYTNVSIETDHDEAISGEVYQDRELIGVKAGIQQRKWDFGDCRRCQQIITEMKPSAMQLVNLAVDHDIRVICINDDVDTED